MKKLKKILCIVFGVILCLCLMACKNTSGSGGNGGDGDNDNQSSGGGGGGTTVDTGIAGANTVRPTDYKITQTETVNSLSATGKHHSFSTVGSMSTRKKVGIFYFVWLGNNTPAVADTSKLTTAQMLAKLRNIEDQGRQYYYGEPLYGYYHSSDKWVIRKHIEMFIAAGIDYMCLDTSNGIYWDKEQDYRPTIKIILDTLLEYQATGFTVPQIMFYTNTDSGHNMQLLFDAFYDTEANPDLEKYDSLWFDFIDTKNANRKRKPWIVGVRNDFEKLAPELQERFYFKDSQWPNSGTMYDNGMPWMSFVPTQNGERPQYNHNGIMNVSMAQHLNYHSSEAAFEGKFNYGRGYSQTDNQNKAERVESGSNFQEQWDYAIAQGDKVNNIFITGWNEWAAQMVEVVGTGRLVDCASEEYSRDAEPMKGGYGDSYYIQICENIRKFKGGSSASAVNPFATKIDLYGDAEQWEGTCGYLDFSGETAARNFKSNMAGVGNYTDNSGRNDIESVRVTYDNDNLYFLITCAGDVTAYESGENWMNILLKVGGNKGTNWEGYTHVINRSVSGNTASVERLKGDGTSAKVGDAQLRRGGKTLTVAVPRSAVGLTAQKFTFEFKVADNVTKYKDIMDYYVTGDCAPIGRLNYTFTVK